MDNVNTDAKKFDKFLIRGMKRIWELMRNDVE